MSQEMFLAQADIASNGEISFINVSCSRTLINFS